MQNRSHRELPAFSLESGLRREWLISAEARLKIGFQGYFLPDRCVLAKLRELSQSAHKCLPSLSA